MFASLFLANFRKRIHKGIAKTVKATLQISKDIELFGNRKIYAITIRAIIPQDKNIATTAIRFCLKTAVGFSQVIFGWQRSIKISIM